MQLILEWRIWLTVNNWIISVTGQLSRRCLLYVYEARDFWHKKNLELILVDKVIPTLKF